MLNWDHIKEVILGATIVVAIEQGLAWIIRKEKPLPHISWLGEGDSSR